MLKTHEVINIIKNALSNIDGQISKPDENGYVTRISANVKVEGHNIYLEYEEDGYVDKYKIEVNLCES